MPGRSRDGGIAVADQIPRSRPTRGSGAAGSITANIGGALTIDGGIGVVTSGILSDAVHGGTGNAGTVTVNAGSISLTNLGLIEQHVRRRQWRRRDGDRERRRRDRRAVSGVNPGSLRPDAGSTAMAAGFRCRRRRLLDNPRRRHHQHHRGFRQRRQRFGRGLGPVVGRRRVGRWTARSSGVAPGQSRQHRQCRAVATQPGRCRSRTAGHLTTTFGPGNAGDVMTSVAGAVHRRRSQTAPTGIASERPGTQGQTRAE